MNDPKALYMMEDIFDKFLKNESDKAEMCRNLSQAIRSLPFDTTKRDFLIQVTDTKNTSDKFFGFRVFPDIELLDKYCQEMFGDGNDNTTIVKYSDMLKRWKHIPSWVIEIDEMVFDRTIINFTPKELVAMVLHEIGHVIYSDKPVEAFYRAFKEAQMRMRSADKSTQKVMYSLYMLPLSIACIQREWFADNNSMKMEIIADKTVVELGYGEHLMSALSKVVKNFGNSETGSRQYYNNVSNSVNWCNLNVCDVIKRKETLKDELYYQGLKTRSNYVKAISVKILNTFGFKLRERYNGIVVEATVGLLNDPQLMQSHSIHIDILQNARFNAACESAVRSNDVALESFFNSRKKIKVELPSQYEVDAISVEIDRITNHHDRIFVLDLIYEILERVQNFEEVISRDLKLHSKWKAKISTMTDELNTFRIATLNKKLPDKKFTMMVAYPEGYQG